MSLLKDDFEELLTRIRHGRDLGPASFEPIYYLVFSPRQILEVKRTLPAWIARLRNENWDVHTFSIAEHITSVLEKAPLRKLWLNADRKSPLAWEKTNQSLAYWLTQSAFHNELAALLEHEKDNRNAIVLVTDLEALHPYLRIGAIEASLYSKFHVPTVFFYPGERTGKTRLRFLGFYPDDGNYRSNHIGG